MTSQPAVMEPRRQAGGAREVWTIRRDWPNRTHDFVCLQGDPGVAAALAAVMESKMRRNPYRPTLSVVVISEHDFWLHDRHRADCMAPDCPTAAGVVAV